MAKLQPIYVVLSPPGTRDAVPFALAGLPTEYRDALRTLRRGDHVPWKIVQACQALNSSFLPHDRQPRDSGR